MAEGAEPTPFLSVVVPAYNEAPRIGDTLNQVLGYLREQTYRWEVVVADDGSTDVTGDLVRQVVAQEGGTGALKLLTLPHGGKGWAVKNGMLHATGEYRFMCDADLSMPFQQVGRFLPPQMSGYDVAVGSREAPGARRIGEPPHRKLMANGFGLLVRGMAGLRLTDTQCGFKCFRSEAANYLFRRQYLHGFAFDVELLYLARRKGMAVVEVPIDWYYRTQSKVRPVRDSLAMASDILRVRWHHRK